jgi:hypothetical protein
MRRSSGSRMKIRIGEVMQSYICALSALGSLRDTHRIALYQLLISM